MKNDQRNYDEITVGCAGKNAFKMRGNHAEKL